MIISKYGRHKKGSYKIFDLQNKLVKREDLIEYCKSTDNLDKKFKTFRSEIDVINQHIKQKNLAAMLRPKINKLEELNDKLIENNQFREKLVISGYRQYAKDSANNLTNLSASEQAKFSEYLDDSETQLRMTRQLEGNGLRRWETTVKNRVRYCWRIKAQKSRKKRVRQLTLLLEADKNTTFPGTSRQVMMN